MLVFMTAPVHLVYGDDEYLVSLKAKSIVDEHVPEDSRDFGLEVIDGKADTVEQACEILGACRQALNTYGFLTGEKLVWLRDANVFQDTVVGGSETVKEAAQQLGELVAQGLTPGTILLITASRIDKRFSFFKTIKEHAEIHEFDVPTKGRAAEKYSAERLGVLLGRAEMEMPESVRLVFAERVGRDSRQMENEVMKLKTFLGTRKRVSLDDIEAITSASGEAIAWDLPDAFGRRALTRALQIARRLLFQKESTIYLVSLLQGRIRDLMIYREALDRGWLSVSGKGKARWGAIPADAEHVFKNVLKNDPRSAHPFRAWLLAEQAQGFTVRELKRCQRQAVSAHRALVTRTSLSESMILETLLVRMLAS